MVRISHFENVESLKTVKMEMCALVSVEHLVFPTMAPLQQ